MTPLLDSHKTRWDKDEILSIHSLLRTDIDGSADIESTYLALFHHWDKSPPQDFCSLVQSILKERDFALILLIIELHLFETLEFWLKRLYYSKLEVFISENIPRCTGK